MPGIVIGILMILTLKEPERKNASKQVNQNTDDQNVEKQGTCQKLGQILKPFLAPSLIMAVLAGSIRNAGKMHLL